MNKLTIGIPTYKRPDSVAKLIKQIVDSGFSQLVDILVIDDGPTDGLQKSLSNYSNQIRLIGHAHNIGYANTFCQLFEECKTEYLLITSDDDVICVDGLNRLIAQIETTDFDFLSTQWLKGSSVFRGRNLDAPIKLLEVNAAADHAPGLVYKVQSALPELEFIRKRLRANCNATFFYPQVTLIFLFLLKNLKCFWNTADPIHEGLGAKTNLQDTSGNTYYSVTGRWKIYLDYLALFDDLKEYDIPASNKIYVSALKEAFSLKAYERLNFAIATTHKDLQPLWVGGSIMFNIRRPLRSIKYALDFFKTERKVKNLLKYGK